MRFRKLLVIAAVALAVYWAVHDPHSAAGVIHSGIGSLRSGADSLTAFVSNAVNG